MLQGISQPPASIHQSHLNCPVAKVNEKHSLQMQVKKKVPPISFNQFSLQFVGFINFTVTLSSPPLWLIQPPHKEWWGNTSRKWGNSPSHFLESLLPTFMFSNYLLCSHPWHCVYLTPSPNPTTHLNYSKDNKNRNEGMKTKATKKLFRVFTTFFCCSFLSIYLLCNLCISCPPAQIELHCPKWSVTNTNTKLSLWIHGEKICINTLFHSHPCHCGHFWSPSTHCDKNAHLCFTIMYLSTKFLLVQSN